MKQILIFLLLSTAALAASADFEAKGPGGFHLSGKTGSVDAKAEGADLSVTVSMATLQTGIQLRDEHLRDKYLQTSQYPSAVLKTAWGSLTLPADGAKVSGKSAQGQLTLHGQTHPVTFTYAAERHGSSFHVTGELKLQLKDFGIEQPRYMGLTVGQDIVTHVDFVVVHG